ncbi:type II secretion system protein GspL [uncultured Ramlibacter sp.]|uniref:type II secretion system protein GspL n=1 Tax=uncultured Ramlibacter sp. TaxID=260755 RepID=UPI00261CD5E7|nr:type II secretion system protein GspL [uncultured Ramlibacter sp.]
MSTLVVLLARQPAPAQPEFDHVLSPDGRSPGARASLPAALLPQPTGAGAEVVAVVPAGALSWHQVELPRGVGPGSARLRAVLEGLLEERLLDEPEALHFALQPQPRPGAPCWVAVCDRAWLRSWVQALEAAQRPASRIVPEFTPQEEASLHALGEADDAWLAAAGPQGVLALPLSAASLALLPALPPELEVRSEPAVAAQAEQLLQRKLVLQQAPERWLQAAQTSWDLAQLEFASSGRNRTARKLAAGWAGLLRAPQWRAVRWGAALLAAVHLLGLNVWAWKERAALESKRVAIETTLTQTFPQIKTVVAPLVQMDKEMALLRQAAGAASGRDLETMLGALAAAAPQQAVTGLEFTGTELRARGVVATADAARPLLTSLKGQGYAATLRGDVLVITPEAAP